MGIQGLLHFIKEAAEKAHVEKYKGQVVAVDTYCWLHKGAYACAEKLAKGEPTDQYVAYCMKHVDMLLSFGVKPILVFDGCTLPSKKEVEKSRREKRQANLLKGKHLLCEGKLSEARDCFARSINVTHAMACEVIKAARARGVDCIVAPYEADAQLAYLSKTGMVQAIITEDSDLLAFGCKKVFLKIDKFGNGLEIDQARLGMCKQMGDVFTEEKFRYMCILSGCDYLPSIHGIGLAKACKLLKVANNPDIIKVIGKMGQYLKLNITVPENYIEGFIRANNTFLYQLVFDPIRRQLVPLNAYSDDVDPETLLYAGKHFGDNAAFQIALGNKDINTMDQIDNYNPDALQQGTVLKVILNPQSISVETWDDKRKTVQPKSRGWNDKRIGEQPVHLKSIWSRSYKPCFTAEISANSAPLLDKPTTRGLERLISTKGLKLPRRTLLTKRPRHEELSEGDLLSQYFFSNSKKLKTEDMEHQDVVGTESVVHHSKDISSNKDCSPESQPKLRNKFALILQKKNEETGAVIVPGTRSRFFCSIKDVPDHRSDGEIHHPSQNNETNCQPVEAKSGVTQDHHSPCSSGSWGPGRTSSVSPGAAQISCFSWSRRFVDHSGTPSPSPSRPLQKLLHQETKNQVTSQDCKVSGSETLSSMVGKESHEESTVLKEPRCLTEQTTNNLSQSSPDASQNLPVAHEKAIGARAPGLHKTSSAKSHVLTKCKSLVPAKVSGLSRRMTSIKKKIHHNAENKSGLQVTINELWKSFQFNRETEKLPSCRKPEPLSPIKDNIQLTPDLDDDAFNKPEFNHVQRKIF